MLAVVACALILANVASAAARSEPDTAFEQQGDPAAGRELYDRHCATCHGPNGAGDGQEGRAFDPGPTDFTKVEPDAERFYRATHDGGMAVGLTGAMPAFRHTLSDEEIHHIVAYLLRLKHGSAR